MERRLDRLARARFDVVVIGGGIYGVCAAREAALRGLAVALVDKGDFGGATSANSHKIVHGGLRYLQRADFRRARESIRERSALLRIAPHLVRPQAFLMPTYGHGVRGHEALYVALKLNDLLSVGRNRCVDPSRRIPPGRVVSRSECLRLAPGIEERGLSGGALWHDGLMLNPERLVLSMLRSAVEAGAEAANYVEAVSLLRSPGRIVGVRVRDLLGGSGSEIELDAPAVVNAAGPWSQETAVLGGGPPLDRGIGLAKAMNLVTRPVVGECAIGLARRFRDPSGAVRRDRRLFFFVPWRDRTLIGTTYLPYNGTPDRFTVTEAEIESFLEEVNWAYPPARLSRADVRLVHAGLVPVTGGREGVSDVELARRYEIRDHGDGVITVAGVKYTTARGVAQAVIDRVFERLGKAAPPSLSAESPVYGGEIEGVDDYVARECAHPPAGVSSETIHHLITNHGSRYREVLALAGDDPTLARPIAEGTEVVAAEILHAVHEEMAVRLADVVLRRTELGSGGHPGDSALRAAARLAARELGWDSARVESEVDAVRRCFP